PAARLVLLSAHAQTPYTSHHFTCHDVVLVGRESAGVPPEVVEAADVSLTIPMRPGHRSLNVAIAAAMVIGEAMRQLGGDARREPEQP
ncbi:MAG: TrmH family RNA methyltransferase, partial [Pseudomonadota bacterium]